MLIKQPNGMFCSCNWDGSNKETNLTEQDVIDMYIEKAIADMNLAGSVMVLVERDGITHKELKEMGSEKTLQELKRYIPLMPTHKHYVGHDFTTYGSCPSCGTTVQDGWGYTEEKCSSCGQVLKWK